MICSVENKEEMETLKQLQDLNSKTREVRF